MGEVQFLCSLTNRCFVAPPIPFGYTSSLPRMLSVDTTSVFFRVFNPTYAVVSSFIVVGFRLCASMLVVWLFPRIGASAPGRNQSVCVIKESNLIDLYGELI
jgi:hypothetical protein